MSFSSDVKKELAQILPPAQHCRAVALAVLSRHVAQEEAAERGDLARDKYFTLLRKTPTIKTPQTEAETEGAVPEELLAHACCKKSLLRESFLCAGSMSDPKGEYHMEFHCADERQARQLIDVLSGFSVEAKLVQRKNHPAVYIKDSAAITAVLGLMGAHRALMEMENSLILKEMRNSINRRVNCETANLEKTVSAAYRQLEDIALLRESGILATLPPSLREVAKVREERPDASLKELGEQLTPPVGKSGVNHRLRKLSELADEVRGRA